MKDSFVRVTLLSGDQAIMRASSVLEASWSDETKTAYVTYHIPGAMTRTISVKESLDELLEQLNGE